MSTCMHVHAHMCSSLTVENMLTQSSHTSDVLYYEVLDMPLQQLEKLKSMRVRHRL